jgi:hypothetical protein
MSITTLKFDILEYQGYIRSLLTDLKNSNKDNFSIKIINIEVYSILNLIKKVIPSCIEDIF